jgi:thymidylate synthase (FAD)
MEPIIELLTHTPEPERLVAVAAKRSYDKRSAMQIWEEMTDAEVARLLHRVIRHGHTSVLEHISFTFAIEGISRSLSHQLVRHRMGSYTQQSQQRSDQRGFAFTVPPEIRKNSELAIEFQEKVKALAEFYTRAIETGVPKGQARYILPNACVTRIIMTMNARSLFNLISQRTCGAEEWEFRMVASKIHRILLEVAPNIFSHAGPRCVVDLVCLEGEKGKKCGFYRNIPGAVLRDGFHIDENARLLDNHQFDDLAQFANREA